MGVLSGKNIDDISGWFIGCVNWIIRLISRRTNVASMNFMLISENAQKHDRRNTVLSMRVITLCFLRWDTLNQSSDIASYQLFRVFTKSLLLLKELLENIPLNEVSDVCIISIVCVFTLFRVSWLSIQSNWKSSHFRPTTNSTWEISSAQFGLHLTEYDVT